MSNQQNYDFIIYILKYLGVALIAGSVVHVGTLDNGTTRYIALAIIGLVFMMAGNIFESKQKGEKINIKYLGLVTALSLATGFLSGGIQHYLDNPVYAGYLLGLGIVGTYITFLLKEKGVLKAKKIILVSSIGVAIVLVSVFLVPRSSTGHHGGAIDQNSISSASSTLPQGHFDTSTPPHTH